MQSFFVQVLTEDVNGPQSKTFENQAMAYKAEKDAILSNLAEVSLSYSRTASSYARSFLIVNSNRVHASVYLKRAADKICSGATDDEIALYVSRESKHEDVDEVYEAERGSNRALQKVALHYSGAEETGYNSSIQC